MIPGETIFRSPLDKPLGLLTEDDISQLTREDCRRYLKEKGMRRPSWNKSQAIEQVISLKSLLETRTESDAAGGEGILRQRIITVPQPEIEIPIQVSSNTETESVPSTEKEKATSADLQVSVSVNDESVPFRRKDPPHSGFSGVLLCRPPVSDTNTTSLRNMRATTGSVGQMTIFYCGEVNVYDGMSADKARFIMQLAASPSDSPQDTPLTGTSAVQPLPCRLQAASAKLGLTSSAAVSPNLQTAVPDNSRQYWEEGTTSREAEPEGPTSRKASLQRYLEKRKDRGKFKIKKKIVGSSSNLEMYLNHQMRGQNSNEHSSPSGTCSPPQPRPPHIPIRCNSLENQADNMSLSVDLNSNGIKRFSVSDIQVRERTKAREPGCAAIGLSLQIQFVCAQ